MSFNLCFYIYDIIIHYHLQSITNKCNILHIYKMHGMADSRLDITISCFLWSEHLAVWTHDNSINYNRQYK